jgi:hypothetical protein
VRASLPLVLAAVCLSGCNSTAEQQPDPLPAGWVQCPAERPQVCTQIYRPVCAWLPDSGEWRTYASDCTACADPAVAGHLPGQCGG